MRPTLLYPGIEAASTYTKNVDTTDRTRSCIISFINIIINKSFRLTLQKLLQRHFLKYTFYPATRKVTFVCVRKEEEGKFEVSLSFSFKFSLVFFLLKELVKTKTERGKER